MKFFSKIILGLFLVSSFSGCNKTMISDGTEAAKILLANERLDASVLTESGTIFTDGKKAMARIIDKTKQYLKMSRFL